MQWLEQAEAKRLRDQTTAVILTALPKEEAAVTAMLEVQGKASFPGDPNTYWFGSIKSGANGTKHVVAVTLLVKYGNNMSAAAVAHVARTFPASTEIVMTGIAGGVPDPMNPSRHVRLGDIAVSNEEGIIQYDMVKDETERLTVRSTAPPPSARLVAAVKHLEAERIRGHRPWEEYLALGRQLEHSGRPGEERDILHDSDNPELLISHPHDPDRRPGTPKLHYGKIGAANKLLKNPKLRDQLRNEHKVIAIEMEASGIADASWIDHRGYLIVRGICDYCDKFKDDDWHGYAALVAASYTRCLIESLPPLLSSDSEIGAKPEIGPGAAISPSSVARSATLERFVLLSHMAFDDAGVIQQDDSTSTLSSSIRLEQLYVPRKIERELDEWLRKPSESAAALVFIVAPAGYGKTSLLWNTFRRYSDEHGWRTLLLKASWLLPGPDDSALAVRPGELVAALRESVRHGDRTLLLIDTVDILLHDDANRFVLFELLVQAAELGVQAVLTSRPEEARQLSWDQSAGPRIDLILKQYDERDEFPTAIERYASVFYGFGREKNARAEAERIKAAVSNGKPLREVCLNPLSLRMLFSLYAPYEISTEINVFSLYCEFWRSRVEADVRAGSRVVRAASENQCQAAYKLALAMLVHGAPALFRTQLDSLRSGDVVKEEAIDALASRGVVIRNPHGSVEFFHQTLFEHAAARALLQEMGPNALNLVDARVRERPNDLFVLPVYEQVLLLALARADDAKKRATAILISRLEDSHPAIWNAALGVYLLTDSVDAEVGRRVINVLQRGDEVLIKRYIDLIPNMNPSRAPEAFDGLEVVWANETWRVKQHTLRLLAWLGNVDWNRVRRFIGKHNVFGYFLQNAPRMFPIDRELLMLARIGGHWDRQWAWNTVLQLAGQSRVSVERITEFVLSNRDMCDLRAVADDVIERAYRGSSDINQAPSAELQELGHLFALQWKAKEVSGDWILSDIASSNGCIVRAKLWGLASFLIATNTPPVAEIITAFAQEVDPDRRWAWIDACIVPLFQYTRGEMEETYAGLRKSLVNWVASTLAATNYGGMPRAAKAYPISMLLKLLRCPWVSDNEKISMLRVGQVPVDAWLDMGRLGCILMEGIRLSIPEAHEVFKVILRTPEKYSRFAGAIEAGLPQICLMEPALLKHALDWADASASVSVIAKAMEHATAEQVQLLLPYSDFIQILCDKALHSRSSAVRYRAVDLWIRLLDTRMINPLTGARIMELFVTERDQSVKDILLRFMSYARYESEEEFERVVSSVLNIEVNAGVGTVRNALTSYVRLLREYSGNPERLVERGFGLLDRPGADEWQLRHFSVFLECLLDAGCADEAAELSIRFLTSNAVTQLGPTGKRTLEHHLSKPFERLFSSIGYSEKRRYLDLLGKLDRHIGRLLVNAACRTSLHELSSMLDETMANPDIHPDIKQLIYNYRRHIERAQGGESWPEIGRFLNAA